MCTSEAVVRPNIKDKVRFIFITKNIGKITGHFQEEKNEGTIEAYLHSCDCNFELRNTGLRHHKDLLNINGLF